MKDRFKYRIPEKTDKGNFNGFQYVELGDSIYGTLCGSNGEPQQCTGLKDVKGNLIYEGNILVDEARIGWAGKVIWLCEDACFAFKYDDGRIENFVHSKAGKIFSSKQFMVAGNIYQGVTLEKKIHPIY